MTTLRDRKAPDALLTSAALLVALLPFTSCSSAPRNAEAREHDRLGKAAYARKDLEGFFSEAKAALDIEPQNWRFLVNYASAASLTGRMKESARALSVLLDRSIDVGIAADPGLAAVRGSKEFEPLKAKMAGLDAVVARNESRVAFTLPGKDLLTEGIAFDSGTGDFFVSSVRHRKIVRRAADGTVSDFVKEGADGLWSVLALAVDDRRRILWACSVALPQMTGWTKDDEGRSAVFAYDLATGRHLKTVEAPPGAKPHVFNDLVLDDAGNVIVADSRDSAIYRLRSGGDSFETVVAPGTFRSPQGMAFSADGTRLYVGDWARGLFVLDVASGRVDDVPAPESAFIFGVDGLVRHGDSLIVTQNLARPARVSRLRLDGTGRRVTRVDILEMNNPHFNEPTLGVLAGDSYYYVAKSQWSLFDEETGAPAFEKLQAPEILELKLGPR